MKIQILGAGCSRCVRTEQNVRKAVENLGVDAEIGKVTDVNEIVDYGITSTPAVVVDGEVKFSGKILSVEEIEKVLK